MAYSTAIWRKMFEIIPAENFGLNLDPSHLVWLMIDYNRVVREFADRIFHVHAKDIEIDHEGLYENGTFSGGMGWQIPRLPGLGDVDWVMDDPIVGTFIGRDKDKTIEANFELFREIWPPIITYAKERGVKVAIENCPMIFSNDEWPGGNNMAYSTAIWRKMFEIIPAENFGLNLDPSHLVWLMIDYNRVVREFADRIFHVHAKDIEIDHEGLYENGTFSGGMGWQIPRLPDLGDVDWGDFISSLYRFGYDFVLSIEHEDRRFEGTEELVKRGFLISRDVLKPYLH